MLRYILYRWCLKRSLLPLQGSFSRVYIIDSVHHLKQLFFLFFLLFTDASFNQRSWCSQIWDILCRFLIGHCTLFFFSFAWIFFFIKLDRFLLWNIFICWVFVCDHPCTAIHYCSSFLWTHQLFSTSGARLMFFNIINLNLRDIHSVAIILGWTWVEYRSR